MGAESRRLYVGNLFPEVTDDDIKTIWLPLIVFDNTDQKEVTRVGMEWEWATDVTVTREGNFTRSGISEVDEAEIFKGAENRLTMKQTYTWEFQCKYQLQKYPFDTQVIISRVQKYPSKVCKIEMTVEDLASGTVALLADTVSRYQDLKCIVAFPHSDIWFVFISGDNDEHEKKQERLFRLRIRRCRLDNVHHNRLDLDQG